ncbi:FkbM family methyltransferase [Mycolicibacterium iranicum]|uniref:FkbM family methyltransferase n=1 Tax=Mycolicibacterium iranicum TaxID=912594 RepID=UPI000DA25C5F|nr:FkbM family methyltransferase [Mycolicibacterium iranicum]
MVLSRPRLRKGLSIFGRPYFFRAFVRHRVAASSEHLEAIRFCAANTLIDVGANKGQFSLAFRSLRPGAGIFAFEPLPSEADVYDDVFADDLQARLTRVALGAEAGSAQFHVADRADSSSLLKPGLGQARAFGVRSETEIAVDVKRLDDCIDLGELEHPILLKADVQGAELLVFDGCSGLENVDYIYVELSFVELYNGQPLFHEVTSYLTERGFIIAGIYNQVSTKEYGPTQVDALFRRRN